MNFREVIVEWKHMDTLQMRPPSTKESVLNVDKFDTNKEVIESNV